LGAGTRAGIFLGRLISNENENENENIVNTKQVDKKNCKFQVSQDFFHRCKFLETLARDNEHAFYLQ